MGLLDVRGRERAARARWILNLQELIALVRPGRRWATWGEWVEVCSRGREWSEAAARKALFTLKRDLRRLAGVVLALETPEGRGLEITVDTPAIVELVELHVREARVIDEQLAARKQKREPDLVLEEDVFVPELVQDYRVRMRHLRFLSRKYGQGQQRLRKILEQAKVEIRPRRRIVLEERRSPEVLAKALRIHDEGGSLRVVARVLAPCSKDTARRFLERHRPKEAIVKKPTIPEVLPLVRELYKRHPAGGPLHIVLDDGNVDDDDVGFCLEAALEAKDAEAIKLCSLLMKMSRTQRTKLYMIAK